MSRATSTVLTWCGGCRTSPRSRDQKSAWVLTKTPVSAGVSGRGRGDVGVELAVVKQSSGARLTDAARVEAYDVEGSPQVWSRSEVVPRR